MRGFQVGLDKKEKLEFPFRLIDGRAMALLRRDLYKAKILKDPGIYTREGSIQYDKPRVLED